MPANITEAEIIRRVAERFGALRSDVATGIGDDAAVLRSTSGPEGPRSEMSQLVTTDTLIEGVHFDLRYMSFADVGYKALAVSLSDINAMGGASTFALGTLGVPRGASVADIDALLDGIEAALALCRAAGQQCSLIGGDTVLAPQWQLGFTVLGEVDGAPLLRSGARVGDEVWHSGALGLSGVGWQVLRNGVGAAHARPVTSVDQVSTGRACAAPTVHVRPSPPLALGPWLQRNGYATAAQDLSDSLSQVALQLAEASGAAIALDFCGYNFAQELREYAERNGVQTSLAELLLAQAEDYELLFTAPPEHAGAVEKAPAALARMGLVVAAGEGNSYLDERGEWHELRALGFEHLGEDK